MGMIKQFLNNTRKSKGRMAKMMVCGINQGHAAVLDWDFLIFEPIKLRHLL